MLTRKFVIVIVFIFFIIGIAYAEDYVATTHVLFLNSYDHRMNWSESILEGLEDTIEPEKNNINLHYEALDSKEFHSEEYYDEFRHYIDIKYREYKFSLIFCSDNNAYNFLIENHKDLYPGVPIVFCGVNNFENTLLQEHGEFTGIAEIPSIKNTVELMLRLHPDSEDLYIINDYLNTGRAWYKQMESELKSFKNRINLIYSDNLSLDEIQDKVSTLDNNTLVLLGVFFADKDGKFSTYERMAELLSERAEVPFYTLVDFNIQKGLIGGKVISGYAHGEAIANIGLKILNGVSPQDIPIGWGEYNRFIFNYPELKRFSISLKNLPANSIIINRPFSLYDNYKSEILLLLVAFSILLISLLALLINIALKKRAERFQHELAEAGWEGIAIHENGVLLKLNEMFTTIFGYTQNELIGRDYLEKIIAPESLEFVRNRVQTGNTDPYEIYGMRKDGSRLPLEVRIRLIEYKQNFARVSAFRDLTDIKKAEKDFNYMQTLWDRMFENSVEAIFIYNSGQIIERVNKSYSRITGYSKEEVVGEFTTLFESEYLSDEIKMDIKESIESIGKWSGETLGRRKSGEVFSFQLSLSVFNEGIDDETKIIGIFHDISYKKQHQEELKWMAQYDALTGFSNRTFFLDILSSELKASERSGEICAVMLLNLDGLKNINNTYGFLAGDEIIKEFSKRLRSGLREEDIVSRFGGDEFAVLAPRFKDRHEVNIVIKRIREEVLNPIIIDGNSIDLSVSIGISLFPSDGTAEKELIAKSGTALKRTKTNRKGSFSLYNSDQDKAVMINSELEMHLKKALVKKEMDVFFQPKVNPIENKVEGFEALIRWHKDFDQWISPNLFIPISEDNGFIIELGYFVINRACDFINSLKKENLVGYHVGVNISAKQFSDPEFIDNLIMIVESKKISPSEIDLEITESITASTVYNTIECLTRLSDYGFSISIDDFGTGYSSLQYLMTLPFDTIKIDKSFVDSILEGDGRETVLDTMISLSHTLMKSIVAEGVETKEQVEYLRNRDCELIQGYYYSKPLPISEIFDFLRSGDFD